MNDETIEMPEDHGKNKITDPDWKINKGFDKIFTLVSGYYSARTRIIAASREPVCSIK